MSSDARRTLQEKLKPLNPGVKAQRALFELLDFAPVRHYVPAGDVEAANIISRWFREKPELAEMPKPIPVDSQDLHKGDLDHEKYNLIVLASRHSNRELDYFQKRNPPLKIQLTEKGIGREGMDLPDGFSDGSIIARVVVTNWVSDDNRAYTIFASNYSRAIRAVAKHVVEGRVDPQNFVDTNDVIPRKMQLAFEVKLSPGEFKSKSPILNEPVITDFKPSKTGSISRGA